MYNSKNNKAQQDAQRKTGIDISKMKQAADNGQLDDFLAKNISADTAVKLKSILSDKSKTEKLLSTPEAKELFKKLTEGK